MYPQQFAGGCIQRDHRTARARSGVEDAIDHQRRAFQLEFRTVAEVVGLESPGDLEFVEIGGVDLIERRVAKIAEVAGIGWPLSVANSGL